MKEETTISTRPRLCIQHDWSGILRTPGEKAWISYSREGEKTVYDEIISAGKAELKVPDGFDASITEKNVLMLKNTESNATSYFCSPTNTFKNLHKKSRMHLPARTSARIYSWPRNCLWRIECRYFRPTIQMHHQINKTVRCLNISPGGSLGVSCSEDETLCIWQADNGNIRRLLDGHISDVTHCRFFPSGVVVLSGGIDMRMKIWSAEDGTCPVTLTGHKGASSRDGTAKLWDCGTAACLTELTANQTSPSVINACALSTHHWNSTTDIEDRNEREVDTTGKLLVLAKDDGIVEGIDIRSRDRVFHCNHGDAINSCCFVNDNRLVAGQHGGDLICLDIRNTCRAEKIVRAGGGVVHCVEPYFKETILVSRGDGTCSCIHLDDENIPTVELIGPNLDAVYDISISNNLIYTACRDGDVRQYTPDAKFILEFPNV